MVCGLSRHEITQQLRKLFPRHPDIIFVKPDSPERPAKTGAFQRHDDFRATIRGFLANHPELENHPNKEAVLTLAEKFLTVEMSS